MAQTPPVPDQFAVDALAVGAVSDVLPVGIVENRPYSESFGWAGLSNEAAVVIYLSTNGPASTNFYSRQQFNDSNWRVYTATNFTVTNIMAGMTNYFFAQVLSLNGTASVIMYEGSLSGNVWQKWLCLVQKGNVVFSNECTGLCGFYRVTDSNCLNSTDMKHWGPIFAGTNLGEKWTTTSVPIP